MKTITLCDFENRYARISVSAFLTEEGALSLIAMSAGGATDRFWGGERLVSMRLDRHETVKLTYELREASQSFDDLLKLLLLNFSGLGCISAFEAFCKKRRIKLSFTASVARVGGALSAATLSQGMSARRTSY